MKIGLITFSRAKNYGGILQAYALYKYLEMLGHDVFFIDYILERSNIYDKKIFVKNTTKKSKFWGKTIVLQYIWEKLYFNSIKNDYLKFSDFIEKHCKFSRKYFSYDELVQECPQADIYVTGSDQIWNSDYNPNKALDSPFYLGFTDGYKISYASSFGNADIPEQNKEDVKKYLGQYAKISVREASGVSLLQELDIDAVETIDPTLLWDRYFWDGIKKDVTIDSKYLLLYQVKFDANIYNLAKMIAKKKKLKLKIITMNRNELRKYMDEVIVTPEVGEWISYIEKAELIFTDSFHATVFSILYNKEFIVNSASRKGMAGRITGLLNKLDLNSREMCDFEENTIDGILNAAINWEIVKEKLDIKRKESKKWLELAVSESEYYDK